MGLWTDGPTLIKTSMVSPEVVGALELVSGTVVDTQEMGVVAVQGHILRELHFVLDLVPVMM